MMQKCIPALRVISMACSYSGGLHVLEFSHSLYCPGCNRSHPHSRNNQQSSHSCHSRYIHSLAVRSHSSGCIPGSSSCNLDSSSVPGLHVPCHVPHIRGYHTVAADRPLWAGQS